VFRCYWDNWYWANHDHCIVYKTRYPLMRVSATAVTIVHPNLLGCGTSILSMGPGRKVCEHTPARRRQTSTLPFPCMLGLAVRLFSASNSMTLSVVCQVASLT
jgi:hypothetical protein